MIDIFVLDKNFEIIALIDSYKSLIWSNRYNEVGDCELYLPATSEHLNVLKKGNYLIRLDDDMVCRIKKVELDTDAENGNFLIVTGYDCKSYLDQRVIWGTKTCDGNIEEFIRYLVNISLGDPVLSARQLRKANGQRMFYLGYAAGFTEVIQEQVSYVNIGEKIRDYCVKYGWGYKVVLSDGALYFSLYKGTDRSNEVIFSDDFENLVTTKYIEDSTNIGNVALVAGEGEGSERARNVSGYAESVDRYEIYVDARDLSKTIAWSDLTALYPTKEQGGQGSIQKKGTEENFYWVYQMDYIDISIVDENQYTELKVQFPTGTDIIKEGNRYYRVYSADIADLPDNTLKENDSVVLRDIVYSVYLLNRGYEKMAEYGAVTTFEGTIEPNTTFIYKQDYFLGDLVKVKNEYGISVSARIVEVIEVNDENGYSIEPKFEYIGIEQSQPITDILITENNIEIITEDYENLLVEKEESLNGS